MEIRIPLDDLVPGEVVVVSFVVVVVVVVVFVVVVVVVVIVVNVVVVVSVVVIVVVVVVVELVVVVSKLKCLKTIKTIFIKLYIHQILLYTRILVNIQRSPTSSTYSIFITDCFVLLHGAGEHRAAKVGLAHHLQPIRS